MGDWAFQYDTLNRLTAAAPADNAPTLFAHTIGCFGYDSFGNRTLNTYVTAGDCTGANTPNAMYNANNQVTFVSQSAPISYSAPAGFTYDGAGNVKVDGNNQYAYDPEGRICAVYSSITMGYTGYLYNAGGQRVASGSLSNLSCNLGTNGFSLKKNYLLDQSGNQVTELNQTGGWVHSNVWVGAHLDATYDTLGLHFHLADPLGTRRVQANVLGQIEETCQSLPFGDALNCVLTSSLATADDATEHHFTGKERDTESGNDYFGARYYASSMGRWMSPDKPFADQHAANPQSWNLYSYTRNNPLRFVDDDGRVVVETRTTTYYPVSGATANEALANANSHSFGSSGDHAGLTSSSQSWSTNTSYTYQTTDANVTVTTTVTSDTITLNQNVQLPQWDGYSKASPEDQKTWDDATSKLQGHETDHENINRAGADALDKSLPGTTSSATGKSLDPTVKASQNNNDAAVQSKADANQQTTNQNNQHLDACTSNGTQACK